MQGKVSSVIAGCFAMAAFAVAIIAGLACDNTASSILVRALVAMLICYPLGLLIGMISERVVDEQIRAHQARHSSTEPLVDGAAPASGAGGANEEAVVG